MRRNKQCCDLLSASSSCTEAKNTFCSNNLSFEGNSKYFLCPEEIHKCKDKGHKWKKEGEKRIYEVELRNSEICWIKVDSHEGDLGDLDVYNLSNLKIEIYSMEDKNSFKLLSSAETPIHKNFNSLSQYSSANSTQYLLFIPLFSHATAQFSLDPSKSGPQNPPESLLSVVLGVLVKLYVITGILIILTFSFLSCIGFNQRLVKSRVMRFNDEQTRIGSISKDIYLDPESSINGNEESKEESARRESTVRTVDLAETSGSINQDAEMKPTLQNPGLEISGSIILEAIKEKALRRKESDV